MGADLKVVLIPVSELRAYPGNARTHSEEQAREIAESINAFGWTNPILVDEDGMILAGHGRLAAAERLALTQVPVIRLEGMTEEEKRAYILADNKIALNATWDLQVLRVELSELDAASFDLDLTGFSVMEVEEILGGKAKGLAERFGGFVPFTVFDARDERWAEVEARDRAALGLGDEVSPTLIRAMLRLFCPAGGTVAVMGGDGPTKAVALHGGYRLRDDGADCLIGIRPAADLLAGDPSAYRAALADASRALRDDAFACVLVDDVRSAGGLVDAIGETVAAFREGGMSYHNEAVVLWPGPVAAAPRGRMPRCHSALLVFCKGDDRRAARLVGESYPEEARTDA